MDNSDKFYVQLLDDTWLMEEPIDIESTIAAWELCLHWKEESVPTEQFEQTFGFSLQELTDYWNNNILKVSC